MRAIILCAGQGKRLLPLTQSAPKCLLPVDEGTPMQVYARDSSFMLRRSVQPTDSR